MRLLYGMRRGPWTAAAPNSGPKQLRRDEAQSYLGSRPAGIMSIVTVIAADITSTHVGAGPFVHKRPGCGRSTISSRALAPCAQAHCVIRMGNRAEIHAHAHTIVHTHK